MMTRKHFETVARVLREERQLQRERPQRTGDCVRIGQRPLAHTRGTDTQRQFGRCPKPIQCAVY